MKFLPPQKAGLCNRPGFLFSLPLFFVFLVLAGCQTVAREIEGPVGYSDTDYTIEKVLTPPSFEFDFAKIPHQGDSHLLLTCQKVKKVEGKRRVVIGKGQEIIDYSGWRELLEVPLLAPLSIAFIPINLIGWLFGSQASKLHIINSYYLINPGQNGILWSGRYKFEKRPGEYKKLKWWEKEKVPFTIQSLVIDGRLVVASPDKKPQKTVPLALDKLKIKDFLKPVIIKITAEVKSGKKVEKTLKFIFDDTPRPKVQLDLSDESQVEKAREMATTFYELAGNYYRAQDYKRALKYFHRAISVYRTLHPNPQGLKEDHYFYRSYFFRGLSRIRQHNPDFSELHKVPQVTAWRAMNDLKTFLNLARWNPLVGYVRKFLPALQRRVYGIDSLPQGEKKKKKEKKDKKNSSSKEENKKSKASPNGENSPSKDEKRKSKDESNK